MSTKLEILDDEFHVKYEYNPIHHIESRVKSVQSILKKLEKKGLEVNIETLEALTDMEEDSAAHAPAEPRRAGRPHERILRKRPQGGAGYILLSCLFALSTSAKNMQQRALGAGLCGPRRG